MGEISPDKLAVMVRYQAEDHVAKVACNYSIMKFEGLLGTQCLCLVEYMLIEIKLHTSGEYKDSIIDSESELLELCYKLHEVGIEYVLVTSE